MKNIFLYVVLVSWITFTACENEPKKDLVKDILKDGDIIFMRLDIGQIKPLKNLSNTDYTHTGIIFKQKDTVFVYEGAGKVILSKMDSWTRRRSVDSAIIVKRLKKEYRTNEYQRKLVNAAVKFKLLPTDIVYDWSDSMMYNSELVWKMYDRGLGIQLCKLKKMKDWKMNDAFVNQRLKEKYKIENGLNPETSVVSPDDLFNSDKLETVYSGKVSIKKKE